MGRPRACSLDSTRASTRDVQASFDASNLGAVLVLLGERSVDSGVKPVTQRVDEAQRHSRMVYSEDKEKCEMRISRRERMSRIQSIRCPICRNYAWDSFMMPEQKDGAWHHPSCKGHRYITRQELRDLADGRPVEGVPPDLGGVKYAGPPGPPHDPPNVPKAYEYLGFGHPPLDKESLKQRLTPQDVMSTPASARQDVRELIAGMLPGDELWAYDNMGFMGMLSGAQGLWVIRNGNVVGNVTFLQS